MRIVIILMLLFWSGNAAAQTPGKIVGRGTLESGETIQYRIFAGKTTDKSGSLSSTHGRFHRTLIPMPRQLNFVKYTAPIVDVVATVTLEGRFFTGSVPIPLQPASSTAKRTITVLPSRSVLFKKLAALTPGAGAAVTVAVATGVAPSGLRRYTYTVTPFALAATRVKRMIVFFEAPMKIIKAPAGVKITPLPRGVTGPALAFRITPVAGAKPFAAPVALTFEGDVSRGGAARWTIREQIAGLAVLKVAGPD